MNNLGTDEVVLIVEDPGHHLRLPSKSRDREHTPQRC
jgi:hypothetical protein